MKKRKFRINEDNKRVKLREFLPIYLNMIVIRSSIGYFSWIYNQQVVFKAASTTKSDGKL